MLTVDLLFLIGLITNEEQLEDKQQMAVPDID